MLLQEVRGNTYALAMLRTIHGSEGLAAEEEMAPAVPDEEGEEDGQQGPEGADADALPCRQIGRDLDADGLLGEEGVFVCDDAEEGVDAGLVDAGVALMGGVVDDEGVV